MTRHFFSALVFASLSLSLPATSQVTFFQPLTFAGCSSFVADFNGDGKPDLLCATGSTSTLNLGNGDGTFTSASAISGTVLAVADFNGDGRPDLLEQGTGTLLVLLGNGDGTFQPPISTASAAALSGVVTADLNGDGKADVVGLYNGALYVYIGDGDGAFKAGVLYNIGISLTSSPLTLADFNGDGKVDVAISTTGQEFVLLGNGDGTFQTPAETSTGVANPTYPLVGDFNGDGKLDLLISAFSPSCNGTCSPPIVYLLPGNEDGTFQSPVTAIVIPYSFIAIIGPLTAGSLPIAAADVNGDGKLDLIFSPEGTVGQVYMGNGDGTFSGPNSYAVDLSVGLPGGFNFGGIAVADFNLDGKIDIAVYDGILLGNGDGTFQAAPLAILPPAVNPPPPVSGKFEKNGAVDIAQIDGTQLLILHNNGAGVLTVLHTYTLQPNTTGVSLLTADFNGDGNLDLAVVQQDTSQNWGYTILLGNGNGTFQKQPFNGQNVSSNSGGGVNIYAADFNNDHKIDLAVTGVGTQSLAILLGNGDGTFAPASYYYDAGGSPALIADFNIDGNLDIALSTPNIGILFGKGDGTFQALTFPAGLSGFSPRFTADFNNDGKADLLGLSGLSNQVALGNGDGTFTLLPAVSPQFSVGGVADFNGDGKLDLFGEVCCSRNLPIAVGVALGNGDGTFGSVINDPSTWYIGDSNNLLVDMNGDGRIDIVFHWAGTSGTVNGLGVLFNTSSDFIVSATVPAPSPIAPGNSAASTVTSTANFGFNSAVALSCAGLPTGATCSFSPATIANAAGTSQLTIATTSAIAPGTYPVQVLGMAGSAVNGATVSLVIQSVADFSMSATSGSPTSQTVTAGQTASFSLSLAGSGTFSGTVNLTCAITPAVTAGPACNLSSSSVQISGGTAQSVTVNVGTSSASTAGMVSNIGLPHGPLPFGWIFVCTAVLVGLIRVASRSRCRVPVLAAPAMILAVFTCVSCGGSSSSHNTQSTPPGTYTATVTATSGAVTHSMALTVTVQ